MIEYNNLQKPQIKSQVSTILSPSNSSDLTLSSTGELVVDYKGDLAVIQDQEVIISNLFRRITTPLGGYERFAFSNLEYTELDSGWSDPLLGALSSPLTSDFTQWAVARLNDIASKDSRLIVLSIEVKETNPPHLQIYYTLDNKNYQSTLDVLG
jgi:hypothetical protein